VGMWHVLSWVGRYQVLLKLSCVDMCHVLLQVSWAGMCHRVVHKESDYYVGMVVVACGIVEVDA